MTDELAAEQTVADGLREMADLYEKHPNLHPPLIFVHAQYSSEQEVSLGAWLDGLDDLRTSPDSTARSMRVARQFGPLEVWLSVQREYLGEVREVETTATQLVPYTLAEIRAAAAKGAQSAVTA